MTHESLDFVIAHTNESRHLWMWSHVTHQVDRKKPPPPGGFSTYYVPWSRAVCKRFHDAMRWSHLVVKSLTHGSWSGNIVNRKPPRGREFLSIKVRASTLLISSLALQHKTHESLGRWFLASRHVHFMRDMTHTYMWHNSILLALVIAREYLMVWGGYDE